MGLIVSYFIILLFNACIWDEGTYVDEITSPWIVLNTIDCVRNFELCYISQKLRYTHSVRTPSNL